MRSTLRFIGEGADYKSRALFGDAQHAHQFNRVGRPTPIFRGQP
jgi:hypothetical protein